MAPARRYDEDDYDHRDDYDRRDEDRRDYRDDYRNDYDRDDRRGEFDRPIIRRRDDDYDDDQDDRRSSRGYRCPFCRSTARPYLRSQVSGAGWAVFVIMILFCTPLFFIGLLMTEEYSVCSDCGMKLG